LKLTIIIDIWYNSPMSKSTQSVSIQLSNEARKTLSDIAKKEGISRHKLTVIGIHHFINHYREDPEILHEGGTSPLPPEIKK